MALALQCRSCRTPCWCRYQESRSCLFYAHQISRPQQLFLGTMHFLVDSLVATEDLPGPDTIDCLCMPCRIAAPCTALNLCGKRHMYEYACQQDSEDGMFSLSKALSLFPRNGRMPNLFSPIWDAFCPLHNSRVAHKFVQCTLCMQTSTGRTTDIMCASVNEQMHQHSFPCIPCRTYGPSTEGDTGLCHLQLTMDDVMA